MVIMSEYVGRDFWRVCGRGHNHGRLDDMVTYLNLITLRHGIMPRKLKKKGIPPEGLVFVKSKYTLLRVSYLRSQYRTVQGMLHHIQQLTDSGLLRLRFPLFNLLRAVSRKLLINSYECVVLGYWLSLNPWDIHAPTIYKHRLDFPQVIYVNDPTDEDELRSLTLFLYLISYSIKEYLAEEIDLFRAEILKLCPNFELIRAEWLANQPTINLELDPCKLNRFFKKISRPYSESNYNLLVDQILHISPCYGVDKPSAKKPPGSKNKLTVQAAILEDKPSNGLFPEHGQDLLEDLALSRDTTSKNDLL